MKVTLDTIRRTFFFLAAALALLLWGALVGFRVGRESAPTLALTRDDDDRACLELLAEKARAITPDNPGSESPFVL